MRIALFARYSSKLQDELSLEAQLREMEAFVSRQQGWEIVRRFELPETRSADIERSPEFVQMVASAKRKEFDLLLLHKLDRFGRNRETSVVNKSMLRRLGIQVRSVVENLGDGVMDTMMEGILEVMSEWYSGNLAQETRKGHRALTRKGCFTGGKVPFGYRVEKGVDGRSRLAACSVTAPVVRQIFEMLAGGEPTKKILAMVYQETGNKWPSPSLYTRIRNPIYKGILLYGRTSMPQGGSRRPGDEVTEGEAPALVAQEVWEKANEILRVRGRRMRSTNEQQETYLLSGLCRCAQCGGAIIGGREAGVARYSCSNRRGGRCSHHGVTREQLEELVVSQVREYLREANPSSLIEAYKESLKPMRTEAVEREKRLRKVLQENSEKRANIMRAIEAGIFSSDIQRRIGELEAEKLELGEEIARCAYEADQNINANVALVDEWLRRVLSRLEEKDPDDIALLLRHVVTAELDLKEKRGTLGIQLPLSAKAASFDLPVIATGKSGRSARTILRPWQTGLIRIPIRWEARGHGPKKIHVLVTSRITL